MDRRTLISGLALLSLQSVSTSGLAQGVDSPKTFLADLYSQYKRGARPPDILGKQADSIFAPNLLKLIRLDQERAGGEVGLLDHDPICACQDFDELGVKDIEVKSARPGQVFADVAFINNDIFMSVNYYLVDLGTGWLIEDLSEKGMPSLVNFLSKGLGLPATDYMTLQPPPFMGNDTKG